MANVAAQTEIDNISKQILVIETPILKLESDIFDVSNKLELAVGEDKVYLRREKEQLRREKEQLRREKEQLRKKEEQLRDQLFLLKKKDSPLTHIGIMLFNNDYVTLNFFSLRFFLNICLFYSKYLFLVCIPCMHEEG